MMIWKPDVTVAALVERDGKFLMVEEEVGSGMVYNQPAGHLEPGEGLIEAAVRETLEETARHFSPTALTGIYRWRSPRNGTTYLRFCFTGRCGEADQDRPLDRGILRALWLDRKTLVERRARLRSPMVLRCIDDYLAGRRYPLELLAEPLHEPA